MRIYKYIILGLTALLCSCAGTTLAPEAPLSVETFTTDGKSTKTVETPWGDKQVYDPTQDPEVIAAFEYVKKLHLRDGPEKSKAILAEHEQLFSKVRKIQYNDMIRLGCLIPEYDGCGGGSNFIENKIPQACPKPTFGETKLSDCEGKNTKIDGYHEILALAAPMCSREFFMIGSKDWRHKEYGDKEMSVFFKSGCEKFVGESK